MSAKPTIKIVNGLKIKEGYVPKSKKTAQLMTQLCPRCNQAIPVTEMANHVKIELLDPKWREQRAKASEKHNKYASNIDNSTVSDNLKKLAARRTDIFGGEDQKVVIERRETVIWDGTKESIKNATEKAQRLISEKEKEAILDSMNEPAKKKVRR